MKTKMLVLALLLCVFLGIARSAGPSLEQQVVAKEREELDAIKAGNMTAFADLIAERAVFMDPRGFGTKAEVVEHTADFKLLEYSMEDVKFVPISDKSGLVAYKLTEKGSSHGHEFSGTVYASAVWAKQDGKWVCVFSQEPRRDEKE